MHLEEDGSINSCAKHHRFMEHEVVLVDMHVKPGVPWQLCPRSTLRRMSQALEKDYGLVVRAGFESEFYLMKQSAG
jgi:glutamine synthetase